MKKTLDDILARNDYNRLTSQLKERVEDIAKRIREKMTELDIQNDNDFYEGEIGLDDVVVAIKSVKSNSLGTYEFLAIRREEENRGNYKWYSLEDIGKEFYYTGDFTALVKGATNKEALKFLNKAGELIKGLGQVEQSKAKKIGEAIEIAKDL